MMIVAQSRTKFPLPSSKTDLPTPIKPIVAILTGLVTPEPGDFHAPVYACSVAVTDEHRTRRQNYSEISTSNRPGSEYRYISSHKRYLICAGRQGNCSRS